VAHAVPDDESGSALQGKFKPSALLGTAVRLVGCIWAPICCHCGPSSSSCLGDSQQ
jgi:hypothetical protein